MHINRLFVFFASFYFASLIGEQTLYATEPSRPNIIFIMSDDQGWGDAGYQGHPILKTPHLDKMAANGMRLNRFYAASPVCSPTRASALTGRHAYRSGVWRAREKHNFRGEELTLAEVLKEHGYRTGFFGKWHFISPNNKPLKATGFSRATTNIEQPWLGPDLEFNVVTPWEQGFETTFANFGVVPTYDPLYTPEYGDTEYLKGKVPGSFYGRPYYEKLPDHDLREIWEGLYGPNPQIIVDRAETFLRDVAGTKEPFLAYMWFNTPHRPVVAGAHHRLLYKDRSVGDQHWYGAITAMDEQIGRVRELLRELGIADNTIVWFNSDNGPAKCGGYRCQGSTGGLRGKKSTLWEGGVRVPGILEWPAHIRAGSTNDTPISTSDFFPSILALLGITPTGGLQPIDGINVWPLIDGDLAARTEPIYFRHMDEFAVVDGDWKLHGEDGQETTLYNLAEDPGENHDLAQSHPKVLSRLQSGLALWEASWRKSLLRE